MAGRRPIPTALKMLRGNPGKRPLTGTEPAPTEGVPEPLNCLTDAAVAHFDTLAAELMELRVLTIIDGPALSALAQAIADFEEATAELATGEKVVQTERGTVRSPWAMLQKQAFDQMQRGFADFGLTPSSRPKIQLVPRAPAKSRFAYLSDDSLFG